MNNEERLSELVARIEKGLDGYTKNEGPLAEAMRYSLLAGGKRLRPVLLIEFAAFAGVSRERALPFACALEMIHTYSLIHDDLPCMDNDDLRRGQPTSHKKFGEATAVLTGDGLLTDAFALMLAAEGIKAEHAREAALEIARGAGSLGMVGGQADDTLNVSNAKEPTLDELDRINDRKTGALISAACRGGLLLGGTSDPRLLNAAGVYAQNLGRAFQITDDILDIDGGQQLGKTAGSDKRLGKHTYVDILGVRGARQKARELTENAIRELSAFKEPHFLIWLTKNLYGRLR